MENKWRRTYSGREQMALGLMAVDRGKAEAIGRRSLLL
jgi:hypothetical protein